MSLVIYGADGNPKALPPERPAPCVDAHCWHLSGEQHTVPNHSDWTCCNCAERRCVRSRGFEHGPHAGAAEQKGCGRILGQVVLP